MRSLALAGLERSLSLSIPALLVPSQKRQRLQQCYRRMLRPVQLTQFNADGIFLAVAPAYWLALHAGTATPLIVLGGALLAGMLLLLDVRLALTHRDLSADHDQLALALADWTLSGSFLDVLSPTRAYTHTLLYSARPWFADHSERSSQATPLRQVA